MKVCPQCHYWQPPEASECDHCGSGLDAAPQQVQPLRDREDELDGLSPKAPSSRTARRSKGSSRRSLVVVGVVVAVVAVSAVAALASFDRVADGGKWASCPTPLAHFAIEVPEKCRDLPLAEEEPKVATAAVGCIVDEGVEVGVVEFDFGGARLDAIDPRFLVGNVLSSHDGSVARPIVDTFDGPTTAATGETYEFTGRGVLHGLPVKTVGTLVIAGNRGIVLVGAAPERDSVVESYERMAASLAPA